MQGLSKRLGHLERDFDSRTTNIEGEIADLKSRMRVMSGELADNTRATDATARDVRDLKADIGANSESTKTILTLIQSLTVLDKCAKGLLKAAKWLTPIVAVLVALKGFIWK